MKKISVVLFLLLIVMQCVAQKVKIKDNVATIDEVYYCKVDDSREGTSFRDSANEELIFAKLVVLSSVNPVIAYYTLTFFPSGEQIYMEAYNSKKDFIKTFYENNVIVNEKVSSEGLAKMKLKYNENLAEKYQNLYNQLQNQIVPSTTVNYTVVERNRNANIFIRDNNVEQDFKVIATYSYDSKATGGQIVSSYSFYSVNGVLVAQAQNTGINDNNFKLTTSKDNRTQTVTVTKIGDEQIAKELVTFLIQQLYI